MCESRFIAFVFAIALAYPQSSIGFAQVDESELHDAMARYVAYRDRGMAKEAQITAENAAGEFPDSVAAQLALAESHHLSGNSEEALAAYDRALILEPDNYVTKSNRAELLEGSSPVRAYHPRSREQLMPQDLIASYEFLVDYVRSADRELNRMLAEFEGEELRTWYGSGPSGILQPEETIQLEFTRFVQPRMKVLKDNLVNYEVSYDAWSEQSGQAQADLDDARTKSAHHEVWSDSEVTEEYLEQNRDRIEELQREMDNALVEVDRFQKAADAAVNGDSNRETIMLNVEAAREAKSTYERRRNEYERLLNPKKFQLAREFEEENRSKVRKLLDADIDAREAWLKEKEKWNQLEEEHGSNSEEALAAQEITSEKYWEWKDAEKAYRNGTPSLEQRAERQRRAHINRARDEHRRERVAETKIKKLRSERTRASDSMRTALNNAYKYAIESHWRSYNTLISIRIWLQIAQPYSAQIKEIDDEFRQRRSQFRDRWLAEEFTNDEFCAIMHRMYVRLRQKELQVHHRYRAQFQTTMRRYFLREQEMLQITRELAESAIQNGETPKNAASIAKKITDETLSNARWGPNGFARLGITELRWPSMCDEVGGISGLEPPSLDYRKDSLSNGVFEDYSTISGDSLERQLTEIVRESWEAMPEWEKKSVVKTLVKSQEGTQTLVDAMRGYVNTRADRTTTISEMIIATEELNQSSQSASQFVAAGDEEKSIIDKAFRLLGENMPQDLIAGLAKNEVDREILKDIASFVSNSHATASLVLQAASGKALRNEDIRFLLSKANHPLAKSTAPQLIVNVMDNNVEAMDFISRVIQDMDTMSEAEIEAGVQRYGRDWIPNALGVSPNQPESVWEALEQAIRIGYPSIGDTIFGKQN